MPQAAKTEGDVYGLVLGQVILSLREKRGLTQTQLANAAGLTQSAVSRIERGLSQPAAYTFRRVAEALGLSVEGLDALVQDAMGRTERAARAAVPSANPGGAWWAVALAAAGVAGLIGLVAFAVAAAVERDKKPTKQGTVGRKAS